jgi:hypothetical protein
MKDLEELLKQVIDYSGLTINYWLIADLYMLSELNLMNMYNISMLDIDHPRKIP